MVSLRRHTHLRLCAGRTSVAGLPWFPDNRNATQNSSHAKPKSSHAMRSNDVNQPKENMSTTRPTSAKNFTHTVLALPVFGTAGSESEHSRIRKLQLHTEGSSLTAEVSLSSQVESLHNQVKDPGVDESLSSQVTSLQSQVKEPDPRTVQLENKIDSLHSMVNKLKEENNTAKVEFDMQQEQADSELLEFDMVLLQTIEKLCQNVDFMQKVDSVMGEPNQMQLRELSQKVEKLREDVSMAG